MAGFTNQFSKVPGPWYTRFTDLPHGVARFTASKHRWSQKLHDKYGPIVRLGPREVTISSPAVHQKIQAMGSGFVKGPIYDAVEGGRERSLFSMTNVREHAERRKLFSRAFTHVSLRKNWESQVRQKVEFAMDQIKRDAQSGTADIYKWSKLMTSDIISLLSFGESFHLLENGTKNEYFAALHWAGTRVILRFMLGPFYAILEWLPIGVIRKMTSANKVISDYGSAAVDNFRQSRPETRNLFSDMLAQAESGTKTNLSDNAIRSEVANMIIAGSDTTGVALTYILWAVLKHPELQKRLEDELASLPPDFKDEDLERIPLLSHVIDESLRLYNPGAGPLQRIVPPGGVTFLGYYLPEGSVLTTLNWNVHRDKSAFPNPEE